MAQVEIPVVTSPTKMKVCFILEYNHEDSNTRAALIIGGEVTQLPEPGEEVRFYAGGAPFVVKRTSLEYQDTEAVRTFICVHRDLSGSQYEALKRWNHDLAHFKGSSWKLINWGSK